MKEKSCVNLKNSKKGITLIALVITIIVMLILVAVTISMAVNGGLFGYAGNATSDTELAKQDELKIAEGSLEVDGKKYDSFDDYINPRPQYSPELLDSDGVLTKNAIYMDIHNEIAVIPKGFKLTNERTISNGLVIEDKDENEFVWIPVTISGETDNQKAENFDKKRTTYEDSIYAEPTVEDEAEYGLMRTSVITNGGFYIGRYEAGYITGRTTNDSSIAIKPLCKKIVYPYVKIGWEDAKTASHMMYNDNTKFGVKSTLCYGVQWDLMVEFLGKTEETDSKDWGNYNDTESFSFLGEYYNYPNNAWRNNLTIKEKNTEKLLQTGAADNNSYKNIFDAAGNADEWTMESKNSTYRVLRGGDFSGPGSQTVKYRRFEPGANYQGSNSYGFRVTLYIEN